jgi:hypothetical protein
LTEPGHPRVHALWAPPLLFEFFYNTLAFVFVVLLLALFFRKRFAWKRCFVILMTLSIGGVFVDYALAQRIPDAATAADPQSVREISRTLIGAAIWIPYVLRSKRVQATFRY